MKRKLLSMKIKNIVLLLLGIVVLNSCKQDNWLDWKHQNELWLVENAKKEGVKTTHTGLQYKCIIPGIGESSGHVDDAKIVTINYSGKLITGYEFDANSKYNGYVSSFVSGFSEGLKLMKEFGVYELYIPYELAYGIEGSGTEGTSSHIPPYSTLIFRVELLDVY
jgi:FKBP-type peptidyl-prolyl cis-trans isomerase